MTELLTHGGTAIAGAAAYAMVLLAKDIMGKKRANGYVKREDCISMSKTNSKEHAVLHERITDVVKGIGRIEGHLKIKVQQ